MITLVLTVCKSVNGNTGFVFYSVNGNTGTACNSVNGNTGTVTSPLLEVSVPKRSALETSRGELSEDVWFGIGTIGTLLVVEKSSLENRPGGCGTPWYTVDTIIHACHMSSWRYSMTTRRALRYLKIGCLRFSIAHPSTLGCLRRIWLN